MNIEVSEIRHRRIIDLPVLENALMEREGKMPSAAALASQLCLSLRTFNRYLKKSGVSYRDVRDQVQKNKATYYLLETDRTIQEIAYTLGYADPSNFTKAFKIWFGVLPREYRKRHRAVCA